MDMRTSDSILHDWLSARPGRVLARMENRQLQRALRTLRGHQVVQFGGTHAATALHGCGDFKHRLNVGQAPISPGGANGVADMMPLVSDSVDTLVLPHSLEMADDPHAVIREAHRVLVPEGNLIISGFNPWSVLGVAKVLSRGRQVPWSSTWLSAGRVRDWMSLLGFQLVISRYVWLQQAGRWLGDEDGNLNILGGQPPVPFLSGVYVLVARKKVIWIRPVASRWRVPPRLAPVGLAEPSTRAARD